MKRIKVKGSLNKWVEFIDIHSYGKNSTVVNATGIIKSYLITPDSIYAGIVRKGNFHSDDKFNTCEYMSTDILVIESGTLLKQNYKNKLGESCFKIPVSVKDKLYDKNHSANGIEYTIHTIYIDENNIIYSVYDNQYALHHNVYDKNQILKYVRDTDIEGNVITKFI